MTVIKMRYKVFIQALFALYLYVLFKIVLFKFHLIDTAFLWEQLKNSLGNPDQISGRLQQGNLVPFREISRTIHVLSSHVLINLFGNIALFMPFGVFLGLLSSGKRYL
jgi:glycopeptide antibiotics resistance protein